MFAGGFTSLRYFALSQVGRARACQLPQASGKFPGKVESCGSDHMPRAKLFLTILQHAGGAVSIKSPWVTGPREATLIIEMCSSL